MLGIVLGSVSTTSAQTSIIDFGDPSNYYVAGIYEEDGYRISTYRMEIGYDFVRVPSQPLQGGHSRVQAGTYDISFILKRLDNRSFNLQTIDLRTPNSLNDGSATGSVLFMGHTTAGNTVSELISYTQGWTTFTLPSAFNDLSSVEVTDGYFNVDNISLFSAVPEPSNAGVIFGMVCMIATLLSRRRFDNRVN